MKILIFVCYIFFSTGAIAAEQCFQNEVNFRTKVVFASEDEYQQELFYWQQKEPEMPGMFELYKAYETFNKAKADAAKLKSDKTKHCFIGCRIAQDTSYPTADYVGWFKEIQDLKDCKRNTHYEEADYIATLRGAEAGRNDAVECLAACKQIYTRK